MEECRLRSANGIRGVPCDAEDCIFWRVVDQLDLMEGMSEDGCAIQKFALLGERGGEIAEWLLSVKERVQRSPIDVPLFGPSISDRHHPN